MNSVRNKRSLVLSLVIESSGAPQSLEASFSKGADPLQRYSLGGSPLFDAANGKMKEEGMKVLLTSLKPDNSLAEELLRCRSKAV